MISKMIRRKKNPAWWQIGCSLVFVFLLGGCQTRLFIQPSPGGNKAEIFSRQPIEVQQGLASWYGGRWIGRLTANGEIYRVGDITAAHKKLPFNSRVRVVDLKTGNSIIVRINNRGPYVKGRIIDLSVAAAKKLGTYDRGIAKVQIEVLREIPLLQKPNLRALNPPKIPPSKPTVKK